MRDCAVGLHEQCRLGGQHVLERRRYRARGGHAVGMRLATSSVNRWGPYALGKKTAVGPIRISRSWELSESIEEVGQLVPGEVVDVLESRVDGGAGNGRRGRRLRIGRGWVSERDDSGREQLLGMPKPPDFSSVAIPAGAVSSSPWKHRQAQERRAAGSKQKAIAFCLEMFGLEGPAEYERFVRVVLKMQANFRRKLEWQRVVVASLMASMDGGGLLGRPGGGDQEPFESKQKAIEMFELEGPAEYERFVRVVLRMQANFRRKLEWKMTVLESLGSGRDMGFGESSSEEQDLGQQAEGGRQEEEGLFGQQLGGKSWLEELGQQSGDKSWLEELAGFVRTVPLLSGLTDAEMSWLVPALVRVQFGGGAAIMRQGDDGEAMYTCWKRYCGRVLTASFNQQDEPATRFTSPSSRELVIQTPPPPPPPNGRSPPPPPNGRTPPWLFRCLRQQVCQMPGCTWTRFSLSFFSYG